MRRGPERRTTLPLPARALLGTSIVALMLVVALVAAGGVGPILAGFGSAFGGVVSGVTSTLPPTPSPTARPVSAPTITPPEQPYTNDPALDIDVVVPPDLVGEDGYIVRLWLTLKDQPPSIVAQAPIGPTPRVTIAGVPLTAGRNEFHATIQGPGRETPPSEVVAWFLDQVPPKLTLSEPADGAVVNRSSVRIVGKTQGRTSLVARNEANGATATAQAANDGTFELELPIVAGTNGITLTGTDVAGNVASTTLSVRRGSGKLTASLTASAYRFQAARLPDDVEFTVTVTDPDGRPLAGATALFTVQIPGIEAIVSSELTTNGDGTAVFRTRVPQGSTPGSGLVGVVVMTDAFGTVTDRKVLTIVS